MSIEIGRVDGSVTRFGKFLKVYLLILLWQTYDIVVLIFIVVNGQVLKNNLTIWSHWLPVPGFEHPSTKKL